MCVPRGRTVRCSAGMALPGGVLVVHTESCPGLGVPSASYGSHRDCGLRAFVPVDLFPSPHPRKAARPQSHSMSSLLWMSRSSSQPLGGAHDFNPCVLRGRVGAFGATKPAMYIEHSREEATPSMCVSRHSGSGGLVLCVWGGRWACACEHVLGKGLGGA